MWFQDESRYGQKGITTKIWARRGSRPTLIRQNGFQCCYMIGAVEPIRGKHFGFCYTVLDTSVMNEFLRLLSQRAGSRKLIILVVDNAGWHDSAELKVPANILLLPLPPYSPELNPIENLWGYLKENFLSHRVYENLDDVIRIGCDVFKNLTKDVIQSVCHRNWVSELYAY